MHCHFIWNFDADEIFGQTEIQDLPVIKQMDCNAMNFPVKCFYNPDINEIYSFYRQGLSFKINPDNIDSYQLQQVIEGDIGQIELVMGRCLVIQSSSKIMFLLQKEDIISKKLTWQAFKTIRIRGSIYFMKGTCQMQVTTNDHVYFYNIDSDTFEPTIENVMINYMTCGQMMIDQNGLYAVAYKTNQRAFDIYSKKYMNDLKVNSLNKNLEGCMSMEIEHLNLILVTHEDELIWVENKTY